MGKGTSHADTTEKKFCQPDRFVCELCVFMTACPKFRSSFLFGKHLFTQSMPAHIILKHLAVVLSNGNMRILIDDDT